MKLWDKRETAEFLRISVASLSRKTCRRELPYIKIGRRVLFDESEVLAFVQRLKVPPR
jgi:excisionase family DNA binding protein